MKTTEIAYSKTFSLGNHENEKIGIVVGLDEEDDVEQAFCFAKEQVEKQHDASRLTAKKLHVARGRELDAIRMLRAAGYDISDGPVRDPQEDLPL